MSQCLRSPSRSVALALLGAVLACMPLSMTAAATASRGDIVVATVHGTVNATMAGMTVPLSAGAILQLPATVRTGADGAVELRQGNSTFAAAGNTELEIPQSAAEDGLIERIIQVRGNAFYNIGKRPERPDRDGERGRSVDVRVQPRNDGRRAGLALRAAAGCWDRPHNTAGQGHRAGSDPVRWHGISG